MSENLAEFLLEKRRDNEDEMETGIKQKYIGDLGELFAYNYLKKLFERNNIRNVDIKPHKFSQEKYDLDIYINGEKYVIEVKTSTEEKYPVFAGIHFNNNFKYLLLIWHPSNDKIYFAILTKDEAKGIATEKHPGMNEDNWVIHTIEIFDEDNKEFLNRLSKFLNLIEELEDLEDEEKIDLIEIAKEQIIKTHKDAIRKDFSGVVYQEWIYEYLTNYTDDVEPKEYGDEYDIEYKGKHIEVKYSSLHNDGKFYFEHIKPNLFDFIFLIGFDKKENKFYFSILTREEILEIKKELAGDEFFSQDGFNLHVGKHSLLNFVNDFDFEDFDKYIESH